MEQVTQEEKMTTKLIAAFLAGFLTASMIYFVKGYLPKQETCMSYNGERWVAYLKSSPECKQLDATSR